MKLKVPQCSIAHTIGHTLPVTSSKCTCSTSNKLQLDQESHIEQLISNVSVRNTIVGERAESPVPPNID